MSAHRREIKVGCCGFPSARREYYERFGTVEIQRTFYQLPRLSAAERWRDEAPPGFEFTMKAWQLITHPPESPTYRRLTAGIDDSKRGRYGFFRPTDQVLRAWEETRAFALTLRARLLIFQCPPSFGPSDENVSNMKSFFAGADRGRLRFVWEPRGGWVEREDLVRELCSELDLIPCLDPFQHRPRPTGGICYIRLHGAAGYSHSYTDEELRRLLSLCPDEAATYVMFNNISMLQDAGRLFAMLSSAPRRQKGIDRRLKHS